MEAKEITDNLSFVFWIICNNDNDATKIMGDLIKDGRSILFSWI